MDHPILNFILEHEFLSNSYERSFSYGGLPFKTVKQALDERGACDNVEKIRIVVEAVHCKFAQHKDLRDRLCDTGNRALVYSNWSDSFWGTIAGVGDNWLGSILEAERVYWLKLKEVRQVKTE